MGNHGFLYHTLVIVYAVVSDWYLHCPSPNRMVQSGSRLRKGFKGESKKFRYCSSCLAVLSTTAQISQQEV